jgi:hypothetical protein
MSLARGAGGDAEIIAPHFPASPAEMPAPNARLIASA